MMLQSLIAQCKKVAKQLARHLGGHLRICASQASAEVKLPSLIAVLKLPNYEDGFMRRCLEVHSGASRTEGSLTIAPVPRHHQNQAM
jgi:hypothetical protein